MHQFTKITSPVSIWMDEEGSCWISQGYAESDILDVETCDELIEALKKAKSALLIGL